MLIFVISDYNNLNLSSDFESKGKEIIETVVQRGIRSNLNSEKTYKSLFTDLNNLYKTSLNNFDRKDIFSQFLKNCCMSGSKFLFGWFY